MQKKNQLGYDSEDENSEEETEEESDSDDSLADLKKDNESSEESETELKNTNEIKQTSKSITKNELVQKRKSEITLDKCSIKKSKIENQNESIIISENVKKELEKAGNELPFTFNIPESYEGLMETLQNRSVIHQKIILERMIKCNHPSLSQGNKTGLGLLFAYILQYINDLFSDIENCKSLKENFQLLSALMPHIYDIAQLSKENTHNSILEVIKEKHQEFRKKKKKCPSLEVLVFLKLVSLLFSTSDFRHQVVTPCFVFMEQILSFCGMKTPKDISYGLFICTLILEVCTLIYYFYKIYQMTLHSYFSFRYEFKVVISNVFFFY